MIYAVRVGFTTYAERVYLVEAENVEEAKEKQEYGNTLDMVKEEVTDTLSEETIIEVVEA
jgi:hypothetical protein